MSYPFTSFKDHFSPGPWIWVFNPTNFQYLWSQALYPGFHTRNKLFTDVRVWRQPANRAVNRQTVAVRLPPSTVPRFHGSAVSRAATAGLHGSTAQPWIRGAQPWRLSRGTVEPSRSRTVPRLRIMIFAYILKYTYNYKYMIYIYI